MNFLSIQSLDFHIVLMRSLGEALVAGFLEGVNALLMSDFQVLILAYTKMIRAASSAANKVLSYSPKTWISLSPSLWTLQPLAARFSYPAAATPI